jgi:hypothetical protein
MLLVQTGVQILQQDQHYTASECTCYSKYSCTGGTDDDYVVTAGELALAYDKFADTESS